MSSVETVTPVGMVEAVVTGMDILASPTMEQPETTAAEQPQQVAEQPKEGAEQPREVANQPTEMTIQPEAMGECREETAETLLSPTDVPSPTETFKTTESMVTVRLSDSSSLPSPTPTLKLVDERAEEHLLEDDDDEPVYTTQRTESPREQTPEHSDQETTPRSSSEDDGKNVVDWEGLEKSEEKQVNVQSSEEGTAFLLARLEQENKRLEKDPKALHYSPERPPSIKQLRKMMHNPDPQTLRYSTLPQPPPLTDLDFYAALVADYSRCAFKLPNLLSKKIRGGIPPPLRGVVWVAMSGARDSNLQGLYDQLLGETSPYEHMIGKDIGRTGLEMFKQEGGEGQRMLARVLRAFSIYDTQIGYCQGLGFLVGPLLMHMGEKEAFCVLVRLMEHYDLRSCFLPNMYGLQLRMYQFTQLVAINLPELAAHLQELGIQPTYASQWFLSFFAITCPLPMLFRIYDVIFAEGAPETIMRVAISLMRRNEKRILACSEFEDVMQMLLGRTLWDTYKYNADDLVQDFVSLSGVVTHDAMSDLEKRFKEENPDDPVKVAPTKTPTTDLQAATARFLGRIWGGSSVSLSPSAAQPRPPSTLLTRTTSKQSLSTVSSFETAETGTTDATTFSRCTSVADDRRLSTRSFASRKQNKDGELHGQIEDLLTALSALQREHAAKVDELEAMRAERDEERGLTKRLVELLGNGSQDEEESVTEISELCDKITDKFSKEEEGPDAVEKPSLSRLSAELHRTRQQLQEEMSRSRKLSNRLAEQDADVVRLKSQVLDTRAKWQEIQKEKQQLQKTVNDMRRSPSMHSIDSAPDSPEQGSVKGGLRELKLGRSSEGKSKPTPTFNKRSSSLGMQSILATANHEPASNDALLLELVAAKTAEAVAKQDAEEARAKLEQLRKVLGGGGGTISTRPPSFDRSATMHTLTYRPSPGSPGNAQAPASNGGGGWFGSGWGKKTSVESR